jgi:opine dehydrogenase
MTPRVAAVIERLDAERLALARAFGLEVRTIEMHFAQSFGTQAAKLADIAAELHAKRGGPPGPTDVDTRFLAEDVPFGLVFQAALGRLAGVATPATQAVIDMAELVTGRALSGENDLLPRLGLEHASAAQLLQRVS